MNRDRIRVLVLAIIWRGDESLRGEGYDPPSARLSTVRSAVASQASQASQARQVKRWRRTLEELGCADRHAGGLA
jgi:hypothetical protein